MNEKILIVDDTAEIREMNALFLRKSGFHPIEASSGPQGLEVAARDQPDIILLDIMMPEMDGYEVCRRLQQNTATKDIPIIFLSSLSEVADKVKGLETGGVDYITKKGDRAELLARVHTHLRISFLTKEVKKRNSELEEKQNRLNQDLQAAATIQQTLLPHKNYFAKNIDLAWTCLPCEYISGDIFNTLSPDQTHLILYILDVSGHGVPSAMVTVSVAQHLQEYLNQYVHQQRDTILHPQAMLKALNQEFPLERFDKFFSLFYLVLNLENGELRYCNAGHPPPLLLHSNRPLELLQKVGTVIGVDESSKYEEGFLILQRGDKLILYTDGVYEYQDAQDRFYGRERFQNLTEQVKQRKPQEIVNTVVNDLKEFGQTTPTQDDISIVCLEYTGGNDS